jgi:hypothetical protein
MKRDGTWVEVNSIPPCDFCKAKTPSSVDGKTKMGPWAYMCEKHFAVYGVGLGTALGQKLIRKEEAK